MPTIFLDHANLEVSLSQETWDLCFTSPFGPQLDHNKLLYLVASLKVASLAAPHLEVLVVSSPQDDFAPFLEQVGAFEGFSTAVTRSAMIGLLQTLESRQFHAVVLLDSRTYEGMRLFASALAKSVAPGGTIYFAAFADLLRYDVSLSRAYTIDLLAAKGFALYAAYYYAFFRKNLEGDEVHSAHEAPDLENQDRILFVVGHARSGSSVLFQMANDQDDIHLTYEANLFLPKNRHDIVGTYSQNQRRLGRKIGKGFHLPPLTAPGANLTELNRALLTRYAIVGDKIALGARESVWESHSSTAAFQWFESQFPFARYLCVLREPMEAVAALDRMIPDRKPVLLLENWAKTAILVMDIVTTFPNQRVILFEDLVERRYGPLLNILGRTKLVDRQDVSEKGRTTKPEHTEEYFERDDVRPLLALSEELRAWYARLPLLFDSETGMLRPDVTHDDLDRERKALQAIDDEIESHLHD